MSAEYDATEFVDSDFQTAHKGAYASVTSAAAAAANRAPSREEVDSKVGETHQKLAELKRIQEELERERAGLEETRRRQMEFQTGRQETIQNLTRGIGLLQEAEFAARRDAEQMAKTLSEMREALGKVDATNETAWTKGKFSRRTYPSINRDGKRPHGVDCGGCEMHHCIRPPPGGGRRKNRRRRMQRSPGSAGPEFRPVVANLGLA